MKTGRLYWDVNNTDLDLGCKPLNKYNILQHSTIEAPTIMVDRGNCTFLTKTKHIEDVGGKVALIINNDPEDPREIFMISDNTLKVSIPTVLIGKDDGEIIKKFWKESIEKSITPEIIIAISFEMKQVDNKEPEKVDLYLTSVEDEIYKFLKGFRKYYEELRIY